MKKLMMVRRPSAIAIAISALCFVPCAGVARAAERTDDFTNLAYCDTDGKVVTAGTVKSIHPRMDRTIGDGNWYAIGSDTTVETLTVSGTANLILVDGATLTVNGGIRVEGDNALNIYGQSAGTGKLIAPSDAIHAPIFIPKNVEE